MAQRPPTFLTGPETAGPGVRLAQVLDLAEPAVPADYSVYPAGAGAEIAAATDELALAA